MTWRWGGSIAAVLIGGIFVYIASSPWLVWATLHPQAHTVVIFSDSVPTALQTPDILDFSSLSARWQYVATHRSTLAWGDTLKTLTSGQVPLHPVAVLYTERWFDSPMLLIATSHGSSFKILAHPVNESPRRQPASEAPTNATLYLSVPGSALAALPAPMQENWNALLQAKLEFTATQPDIVEELAHHERILVTVTPAGTAVGIRGGSPADQERWAATHRTWVVNEDRFRRPVEQAFRLPDGTLGREKVAGLPGDVWTEATGNCKPPLPGKPALWSCTMANQQVLASYYWQPDATRTSAPEWEITVDKEFLASLPHISMITAWGSGTMAAADLRLK